VISFQEEVAMLTRHAVAAAALAALKMAVEKK